LNKILITIQGRTLILYYQIKHGLKNTSTGFTAYIAVLPSDELSRFDLKGLTPEMFCVNIADMVNVRGMYSGQVENERQIPVAKWDMNYEEYLQMRSSQPTNLTHQQIVTLLAPLPGFVKESDKQYIDFEERVVSHTKEGQSAYSGYRLTIVTEDIEGDISTYAYFSLDTATDEGWQDTTPPQADWEAIKSELDKKLQAIREAGVTLIQVQDETDYVIAN